MKNIWKIVIATCAIVGILTPSTGFSWWYGAGYGWHGYHYRHVYNCKKVCSYHHHRYHCWNQCHR